METNKQQAADKISAAEKKQSQPSVQNKPDEPRVPTVTPDNDNGRPGAPANQDSSNKGKGPAGENL